MAHKSLGFSLLETLIIVAILGILLAITIPRYVNANKNVQSAAAQAYAHHMATWLAAAEAGSASITQGSLIGSCLRSELQEEGAPDTLPANAVVGCRIEYENNHYTITVVSTSGRGGPNNDGTFTASY